MLNGPKRQERVAVFISGGGSTLQSLLEMQHQIGIELVVTNRRNALGVLKAKRFGKQIVYFNKEMTYEKLSQLLIQNKIEKIVLAGFMKLLPTDFLQSWKNKIVNIHPSLLPKYPGLNSAERCWEDDEDMGVSIHNVIEEVDAGLILLQQTSLNKPKKVEFSEANIFLRKTEQHLLRELAIRYY